MRVLLIGDSHFLVPSLAETLLGEGVNVALLDKGDLPIDLSREVFQIREDPDAFAGKGKEIRDFAPDTVVLLGAKSVSHVGAFCSFFDSFASHYVVASSANVYKANATVYGTEEGNCDNAPIVESAPLRKKPLGKDPAKDRLAIERRFLDSPVPTTVMRLPCVYGPYDRCYRLLPQISRMLDDRPYIVLPKSQASWRWTHASATDIGRGIGLATLNVKEENCVFNLGEARTPTAFERVEHLSSVLGWEGDVVSLPEDRLPPHIVPACNFHQHLVLDSGKARNELGYRETQDYYEGLTSAVDWYRDNLPPQYRDAQFNYESEDALCEQVKEALEAN